MSAVAIFLEQDAAWLATDGATYRYGEGQLVSLQQKAFPLVHLNAVVTIRGPQAFAHKLLPVLNARFATFEDLVEGLHLAAWVVHDEIKDDMAAQYGNAEVEVYVVGWSHERARAEAHVVVSHNLYGEPWQRLEIDRFGCAPAVAPSEETNIPVAALDVVQRQRLERDEHGHCCVGGLVQLTQVTADAIHSAVVHRWPDQIGAPLGEAA